MIICKGAYCSTCRADGVFVLPDSFQAHPDAPAEGLACCDCGSPYAPSQAYRGGDPRFSGGFQVSELAGFPIAHSEREYKTMLEKNGVNPDTGGFLPYGEGGERFN